MTPQELKEAQATLGLNNSQLAEALDVRRSDVESWRAGPEKSWGRAIPKLAAKCVELMLQAHQVSHVTPTNTLETTARIRWTPELVIDRINERRAAGLPLSTDIMNRTCGPLFGAGKRLFGSWTAALSAAGIDPKTVRAQAGEKQRWSTDIIIERIREHAAAGRDLSAHRMSAVDSPLVASAPRYCGSWEDALRMAGFDPDGIRLYQKWTPERVTARIQQLHRERADLSDLSAQAYDAGLYGAAQTHYGGWRQAIEASGVDYSRVRRINEDWTRERVVDELKRMHGYGVNLSRGASYTGLYPQIIEFLGGMDEAYRVVGEQPPAETIISNLREYRLKAGLTQDQLGVLVERSHRSIGLYESAEHIPALETALKISLVLKTPVNKIWRLVRKVTKKPRKGPTRKSNLLRNYAPILEQAYRYGMKAREIAVQQGCTTQNVFLKLRTFDDFVERTFGVRPGKLPRKKKPKPVKPPPAIKNLIGGYEPFLRMIYKEMLTLQEIADRKGTSRESIYAKWHFVRKVILQHGVDIKKNREDYE